MKTYYYKRMDAEGNLLHLLTYDNFHPNITDPMVVEINEEEYNALVAEIEAAQPNEPETDELSAEEALDIIIGGATA